MSRFGIKLVKSDFSILRKLYKKQRDDRQMKNCQNYCFLISSVVTPRKVSTFSNTRNLCCYPSKIKTKRPNLRVVCQMMQMSFGIVNSEGPDQIAPLGAV